MTISVFLKLDIQFQERDAEIHEWEKALQYDCRR